MSIFGNLRDLDPAMPRKDSRTDPSAAALLDRLTGDRLTGERPHPAGAPGPVPQARWHRRGPVRLVLAGAATVGVAAAVVTFPGLIGSEPELAWSAVPEGLPDGVAASLVKECTAELEAAVDEADEIGGDAVPVGEVRALAERRGGDDDLPTTMVLVADEAHDYTCYFRDGELTGATGSVATEAARLVVPADDSIVADLGSLTSTAKASLRQVSGTVGGSVAGVTLRTVAAGDVVASVENGLFAAWWKDRPYDEWSAGSLDEPEITGAELTLEDGSTREVTVDQIASHLLTD